MTRFPFNLSPKVMLAFCVSLGLLIPDRLSLAEERQPTVDETVTWLTQMLLQYGRITGRGKSAEGHDMEVDFNMSMHSHQGCLVQVIAHHRFAFKGAQEVLIRRDMMIRVGQLSMSSIRLIPLKESDLFRIHKDDSLILEGDPWVVEIGSTPPDSAYTITYDNNGVKHSPDRAPIAAPFLSGRKDIAERSVKAWRHAIRLCGGKAESF